MSRQIASRLGQADIATLDHRVAVLEARVAVLAEALQVLARGLEGSPLDEPAAHAAAEAARHAADLLRAPVSPPPR